MSDLAARDCIPCRGGVAPLDGAGIAPLKSQLDPDWKVVDGHHLARTFRFENFAEALQFTDRVGAMAEEQSHHPDLHLAWGRVTVEIWTHKIDGLHESDFIFAARCDALFAE
ncbi:MAG: 4a-hydroxytetrahydrobiopterin dehydratase [Myxococcota bacterium]